MITDYKRDYFKEARTIINSQGNRNYIERLLPGGKWEGNEYVVKNPTRCDSKAGSFSINQSGVWSDFQTGDAGRDLIDLTAYVKGISKVEACFYIGVPRPEKSNTKTTLQTDIKPATEPQLIVKQEHTLINDEAMLELEQEAIESDGREPAKEKGQVAIEPPAITARDTEYFNKREFKSDPTNFFQYQNSVGVTVGYIARWDFEEQGEWKKAVRPYTYNFDNKKWESKFFGSIPPKSRPLYNLPEILKREDAPVMIVEGEKTVEAAKLLFPDYVITTSSGGASQAGNTEWHWLNGREIIISPDSGKAGADYAERVTKLLKKNNVTHIKTLEPSKLGNFTVKNGEYAKRDNDQPKGYDLANSLAEGWTHELIQQAQQDEIFTPFFKDINRKEIIKEELLPQDELYELGGKDYKLTPNGLYKKILVQVKEESEQTRNSGYVSGDIDLGNVLQEKWQPLCGYLKPTHKVQDVDNSWGMLTKFKDLDGVEREVFLKRKEWLAEKGAIEVLQDKGLQLNSLKQKDFNSINEYLNNFKPKSEAVGVDKVGWQGDENEIYILPFVDNQRNHYNNKKEDGEDAEYILQLRNGTARELKKRGSLEEWKRTVGEVCRGNHLHSFALFTSFAAPALRILGEEGSFWLLVGASSIGKSTLLKLPMFAWGGQELDSFNSTVNGLEGLFKSANDGVLFLDEIGEIGAEDLSKAIYMGANGVAKARLDKKAEARKIIRFLMYALCTGEIGVQDKLAEKKIQGKAGQFIRMPEMDANRGKGFNTFDVLNINPDTGVQFENGKAQAEYLEKHAKKNCGVVIDEFLKRIVGNEGIGVEKYKEALLIRKEKWLKQKLINDTGVEVARMAKRYSTTFASGALASFLGIVPHTVEEVQACVDSMFQNWLERRGGDTPHEFKTMIDSLYKLCKQNQYSRFKNAKPKEDERIDNPKDMAGYWKDTNEGKEDAKTEFWIFPKVFDREILQGRDKNSFLPLLVKNGYLTKDKKYCTQVRRPQGSNSERFYIISADALNGEMEKDKKVTEEVEKYGVFPPAKI
jgi:putative DNA primase/helicase